MAIRKRSGWTTETSVDGQISIIQPSSMLEVVMHEEGVYEIEFNDAELGLVLETDFYGQHAIVRAISSTAPVARLALIQEGDVLVAVNDTVVLHERFQNIIRYISTLKQQNVPRKLRFLNPLQCPVAVYEEKLQLGRKDQKDIYGFHRTLEHLLAERQHLGANMQKFAQRDLEWFHFIRQIGGLHNLKPDGVFKPSPELKSLVRRGIPVMFRPRVWAHLCGAHHKRSEYPSNYYKSLVARAATDLDPKVMDDIDKDVDRTFPEHAMFHSREGVGALRKLLFAYALHNPDVGYCQSLNFIAGMLLLFMDQEDGFWLISAIVEDLLPADYYSKSMIGCHVDQYVFAELIEQKLPKVRRHLERAQLQLPLITLQWFLCLFVNTLPTESALRVWDMFFNEGDKVLFRIAIGLLKMHEAKLLAAREETGELFTVMRELGREVVDADLLIATSYKLKKLPRPKPRVLEQVSKMTLDDLEGFNRIPASETADHHEEDRQAITGSDVDVSELTHPLSPIEAIVASAPTVRMSSFTTTASTDGTAKRKSKKSSFLNRNDYRSFSRDDIRVLRDKHMHHLEEKRQAAQLLREQWQRDEAAGLHKRTPIVRSTPTSTAPPADSAPKEADTTIETEALQSKVAETIAEGNESDDDEEQDEDAVDDSEKKAHHDANGANGVDPASS